MAYMIGRKVSEEEARELARELRAKSQEDFAEIVEGTLENQKNYSLGRLVHDIVGANIGVIGLGALASLLEYSTESPEAEESPKAVRTPNPEAVPQAVIKLLSFFSERVPETMKNGEDIAAVREILQNRLSVLYKELDRREITYKNPD